MLNRHHPTRVKYLVLVVTVVFGMAVWGGSASAATVASRSGVTSNPARATTKAAWQVAIAQLPSPGRGCFTASYPSVTWNATKCKTAPEQPLAPVASARQTNRVMPMTVGNGYDHSAQVAGTIFQAIGSFTDVSSGITETGQIDDSGPQVANEFTLQLNTQFFSTEACSGSSDPSDCRGWEQFVYETNTNIVFMQYWLITYNATCPSGWGSYGEDCYKNSSETSNPNSALTAGSLATVKLEGTALAGSNDAVTLINGTTATQASNNDSVLDLAANWNTAEYGVFGDADGGQANFGSNTTLEAVTTLGSSSATAPSCVLEGFTGETNNLNLVGTPTISKQDSPTLISKQSNKSSSSPSCATAKGTKIKGYTYVEADTSVSAGSQGLATAQCPSGDVVVGGGGYQNLQSTKQSLNSSWPSSDSAWSVYFNNTSSTASTGVAIAYCATASSVKDYSLAIGSAVSVPTSSQVQSVVICPSGTVSLGGGWFNDAANDTYGAAASAPYGSSGWRTYLVAGPDGSTTGEADAVCASQPSGWVQLSSPYATNGANTATTVTVNCPSGTEVLGGGAFNSSDSPLVMIGQTSSLSDLEGWDTAENNTSSSSESVDAWGICANV